MVAGGGMCGCGGHVWLWGACVVVGVCMVAGGVHCCGEHAWLWGACVVAGGDMHGCRRHA